MVLLKNFVFAESDSAQANTARSQNLKCSQIQNWLTLCGVKLIFLIFQNLFFQGILNLYDVLKNFEYFLLLFKGLACQENFQL